MADHKRLIDMGEAERIAWGTDEHEARVRDLSVRTPAGLMAAQANAESRRRAVGATKGQAAEAVHDAAIARRRAEARTAAQENSK